MKGIIRSENFVNKELDKVLENYNACGCLFKSISPSATGANTIHLRHFDGKEFVYLHLANIIINSWNCRETSLVDIIKSYPQFVALGECVGNDLIDAKLTELADILQLSLKELGFRIDIIKIINHLKCLDTKCLDELVDIVVSHNYIKRKNMFIEVKESDKFKLSKQDALYLGAITLQSPSVKDFEVYCGDAIEEIIYYVSNADSHNYPSIGGVDILQVYKDLLEENCNSLHGIKSYINSYNPSIRTRLYSLVVAEILGKLLSEDNYQENPYRYCIQECVRERL